MENENRILREGQTNNILSIQLPNSQRRNRVITDRFHSSRLDGMESDLQPTPVVERLDRSIQTSDQPLYQVSPQQLTEVIKSNPRPQ